jgi:hypothetical protein
MDFFHTPKQNGEKIRDYFWGFFGVALLTFIIINLCMMPKTN